MKTWEEMPIAFVTSAVKRSGRKEILEFIESLRAEYKLESDVNPEELK